MGSLPNFTLSLLTVGTVGLQRKGACTRRQQLSPYFLSSVGPRNVGSRRFHGDEQRGREKGVRELGQKAKSEETGSTREEHQGVGQSHP